MPITIPTIIGIDQATRCGWCVRHPDGRIIASGVWDLRPKRHQSPGSIIMQFRADLRRLIDQADAVNFDAGRLGILLAYEEVRRHLSTDAAHKHGALTYAIHEVCETRGVAYRGIPVGTIKRTATGRGNADKAAMMAAARAQWPDVQLIDDNHADALWIAESAARDLTP